MRTTPTDVEALLWHYLRRCQLAGVKFRRQHPIGPFIADFACLSHRLIVEVDGGQHDRETENRDGRTRHLQLRGYHVLRFWDHEVLEAPELVVDVMLVNLQCTPPQPSPACAREGESIGEREKHRA